MLTPTGMYKNPEQRPVWQRGGMTFAAETGLTASEALDAAGMMFEVNELPLTFTLPTGDVIDVPGQKALVREPIAADPQHRVFGVVTSKYQSVSTAWMSEQLDPLSEKWPVDSAGGFKFGRDSWVSLRMSPYDVAGDENEQHQFNFFAGNSYGGGGGLVISQITWRVVCLNTYAAAMRGGSNRISVPHKGDPKLIFAARTRMEEIAIARRERTIQQLEAMVKAKMDDKLQIASVIDATFPMPSIPAIFDMVLKPEFAELEPAMRTNVLAKHDSAKEAFDNAVDLVKEHRVGFGQAINEFNDLHPKYAGTAYGLVNAGTFYANHREGRNDTVAEKRAAQVLTGDRSKEMSRTWNAVAKLMSLPLADVIADEEIA